MERFQLWQGHHHRWDYNHRVNRLGSWVRHAADGARVGHAGASGTGADRLSYQDFYVGVDAAGVSAFEGYTEMHISAEEAHRRTFHHDLHMPVPVPAGVVLLNGFDLAAVSDGGGKPDADKLLALSIGVSEARFEGGMAHFRVLGGLNVDCDSAECDLHPDDDFLDALDRVLGVLSKPAAVVAGSLAQKFDTTTHYRLRIYWIIVCGLPDALGVTALPAIRQAQRWGVGKEVRLEQHGVASIAGALRFPERPAAVLGITRLHVRVRRAGTTPKGAIFGLGDQATHLLELDQAVHGPVRAGSQFRAVTDQLYKNWTKPMPVLAYRDAVRGQMRMGLSLLELASPRTLPAPGTVSGTLHWPGKDAPADGEEAQVETTIGGA